MYPTGPMKIPVDVVLRRFQTSHVAGIHFAVERIFIKPLKTPTEMQCLVWSGCSDRAKSQLSIYWRTCFVYERPDFLVSTSKRRLFWSLAIGVIAGIANFLSNCFRTALQYADYAKIIHFTCFCKGIFKLET